jgi:hypothetical protein
MKLHPTIADLLGEIDTHIAQTGITPTEFGVRSIKDPNLYRHLKAGRIPRLPTIDRVRAFMAAREGAAA